MEIAQFLPVYPLSNDLLFEEKVRAKKEFQHLESHNVLERKFTPLPHQIYAQRILSGYTPYEASILFQRMGTGKTGLSILTVENNLNMFRGGLIIVPSQKFVRNFENEILKVTGQKYFPPRWQEMTNEERQRAIRKQIRKNYKFLTYEAFANALFQDGDRKVGDPQIEQEYSNYVIIADEAQNLRKQKNKPVSSKIYEAFFIFFHTVKNCKKLLLTGTPMKDQWSEMASLANLILPLDKQLPTGDLFEKEFFNDGKTIANEHILKERLRGYISVLQSQPTHVKRRFVGSKFQDLTVFEVDLCQMSEFQSKVYQQAYADDDKSGAKNSGIYSNSQQAINFVFPDGTYGKKGFTKHMVKPVKDIQLKARSYAVPVFSKTLRDALRGANKQETLNNIWQCSSKYATSIRDCLEQYQNKAGCTYIYNPLVDGSGALVFAQCLELFGYTRSVYGKETEKGLRYVLLTNSTIDDAGTIVSNVQETFADPRNARGEYIHVIIGSRTSGEGLSFGNIQLIGVHNPFWNYSVIDQAIYRGLRRNSHQALEKIYQQEGKELVIDIHQYMALPLNPTVDISLDYQMYQVSQAKDLKIKRGERLMKEIAYDCLDKYKINSVGQDFTRECDYSKCEYKCDHAAPAPLKRDDLTYNLHYSDYDSSLTQFKLTELFRKHFRLSFAEIRKELSEMPEFILLKTLKQMIETNVAIYNKYGVISYLKEQSNIYFLVSSPETNSKISLGFYAEYPTAIREMSLSDFNTQLLAEQSDVYLQMIAEAAKRNDLITIEKALDRLSDEVKIGLIQELIDRELKAPGSSQLRNFILNRYKGYIHRVGDVIALDFDEDTPLCRSEGNWISCDPSYVQYIVEQEKKLQTSILEQNPVGFYALINKELHRGPDAWKKGFWIVDLRRKAAEFNPQDKRTEIKGEKCGTGTLKIGKLAGIAFRTSWQPQIVSRLPRDTILNELLRTKELFEVISQEELFRLTEADLQRLYTFRQMKAQDLCNGLSSWFEQNGLVRYTSKESMK